MDGTMSWLSIHNIRNMLYWFVISILKFLFKWWLLRKNKTLDEMDEGKSSSSAKYGHSVYVMHYYQVQWNLFVK